MGEHFLSRLFAPRSVAVFGASERPDAPGTVLLRNLRESSFAGGLFAINPEYQSVQGLPCHASLADIVEPIDLAVIATPAAAVPQIINDCGEHGVRAALVVSAGFRDAGPNGAALEQEALANARRHGLRFLGPNCLGLMRPATGLNATVHRGGTNAGNLALVSQSGALSAAILDWAQANDVGFSTALSMGTSADLDFGDVLDYLVSDPTTHSILLYVETIRHARSFMSALRAAARVKPVIVLRVGRHGGASRVAQQTGAVTGRDDVFAAALRRAGVVRAMTIDQLFAAAKTLAGRYRACGERLAIVTNGGGPGLMAADRAADIGIPLAVRSDATSSETGNRIDNPLDLGGNASAAHYRDAVAAALQDGDVDAVLVILTPQALSEPVAVADALCSLAEHSEKPLLACWMGGPQVEEARVHLGHARIPSVDTPEAAVEAFSYLTAYYQNQTLLLQTPGPLAHHEPPDMDGARMIIENALAEHRNTLGEMESKALLRAFQIPVAQAVLARSATEALVLAEELGFPVALKISSPDIIHKWDAGGVRLNLNNAPAVRSAYQDLLTQVHASRPAARIDGVVVEPMCVKPNGRELIVGMNMNAVFGPVITFGAGGIAVEALGDRAVALPPLNAYLAGNLIGGTRIACMLKAFRHMPPVDMEALESLLLRVSEMTCELPWLQEMDVNLIIDDRGALAVDARVLVEARSPTADRYARMAIHPYPSQLVSTWQLTDGTSITIRPIRPEDAKIERDFVRGLSERSRYYRFMQALRELTPQMLVRFTQIDYDREMALIAVTGQGDAEIEIAVGRYAINPDGESCEFALVVDDAWQHRGIGHRLMEALMEQARSRGLQRMEGQVLSDNREMLKLVRALGFAVSIDAEDPNVLQVVRRL